MLGDKEFKLLLEGKPLKRRSLDEEKHGAALSGIFTFVKTPEGWFGPIKRVDNEGWDWETAIPDTLMPSSIAAELDKRAQGADRVFIDRDGMDQFLEAARF